MYVEDVSVFAREAIRGLISLVIETVYKIEKPYFNEVILAQEMLLMQ